LIAKDATGRAQIIMNGQTAARDTISKQGKSFGIAPGKPSDLVHQQFLKMVLRLWEAVFEWPSWGLLI
jgi:hypothetical protein